MDLLKFIQWSYSGDSLIFSACQALTFDSSSNLLPPKGGTSLGSESSRWGSIWGGTALNLALPSGSTGWPSINFQSFPISTLVAASISYAGSKAEVRSRFRFLQRRIFKNSNDDNDQNNGTLTEGIDEFYLPNSLTASLEDTSTKRYYIPTTKDSSAGQILFS
jgi:hypothetical protein